MGRDLMKIAGALVREFNRELGREVKGFTKEAEARLLSYAWPGNVRELRNVLERAMIFSRSRQIESEDIILNTGFGEVGQELVGEGFRFPINRTLEELEQAYITQTLKQNEASYAEVADILGISKKTLWEKRKRYSYV
jgi:DNA-binding NtrC family response regulator